jgi:hypothetical protein
METLRPPTALETRQARRIAQLVLGSLLLGPMLSVLGALISPILGALLLGLSVVCFGASVFAFVRFKVLFARTHRLLR